MKSFRTLIIILCLALLSACNENNVVKVGNPDIQGLPDTQQQIETKQFLASHDHWKASTDASAECKDDLYVVQFDATGYKAKASSIKSKLVIDVPYTIKEDGTIVSTDTNIAISGTREATGEEIKVSLKMNLSGCPKEEALFESVIKDAEYVTEFTSPDLMCKEAGGCIDMDTDLNASDIFVKGFVLVNSDAGECGQRIDDVCEDDGKVLAEAICERGEDGSFHYSVQRINCDCNNGRCFLFARVFPAIITGHENSINQKPPELIDDNSTTPIVIPRKK